MKRCRKCNETKDFSEFSKNRSRKDGYCNYCKLCDRKKVSGWREENIEYARDASKKRYRTRLEREPDYSATRSARVQDTASTRYNDYKKRAGRNGLVFEITKPEFAQFTSQPCYYCGEYTRKDPHSGESFVGLDRINNEEGYTIDNVEPCCKTCNYMRRILPREEFIRKCNVISGRHRV